ncbi:XRE family transcriptional regulator [Curtobacterium oceanosedimentum]|uniref:XRE family transcriptional regulator n=1 Tax=Curtobacterium oceanosedimentum TaxID=465820 RepID=A0A147DQ78_9MICO|nr:helix-turn-helix transcriptional regulator [Curtobacterium oceanosedimentum]KTR37949.1 XRE family transcriptional regulator [Curtobacterium oceanosedimentum]KTR51679.1 XRE family transcriptional regulator [Curtobacterium oceanosedimentum]
MVRLPLSPDELERGRRLGALLRSARGDRSILDVALDAGISPETLRKIETGRIATPSFASIAAVAGVVGLSLDALWAEVHPPSPTGSTHGGSTGVHVGAARS